MLAVVILILLVRGYIQKKSNNKIDESVLLELKENKKCIVNLKSAINEIKEKLKVTTDPHKKISLNIEIMEREAELLLWEEGRERFQNTISGD